MKYRSIERPALADGLVTGRIDAHGIESRTASLSRLYDLEFFQMDRGEMIVNIDYLASATSVLYLECYRSLTHALGSLRHGLFGFALPITESGTVWWGRMQKDGLSGTAIGGETIDISFKPGHRHYVAIIPHQRLLEAATRACLGADALKAIRIGRAANLVQFDPELQRHIGTRFDNLLTAATKGRLLMTPKHFDDLLLGAALSLLNTEPPKFGGAHSSSTLVRRALELYDAMPEASTITSLCLALRASPRTMEAAFKTCTGMGPHRFFLHRRLNRARNLLLNGKAGAVGVTDVALELGFTELGRFSVRYRKLFGESPSATLKRA